MADAKERAVRKLERQIARAQRRLTKAEGKRRRRGGLLGGVVLGTVAGGLLIYYLTRRNQDDEWEREHADDSIVLRDQPVPTGQTADIEPLPTLNVAAEEQGEGAAITPEEIGATGEPAPPAQRPAPPATLLGATQAQAQTGQPQQNDAPPQAAPPAKQSEQQAKATASAPSDQPGEREGQDKQPAQAAASAPTTQQARQDEQTPQGTAAAKTEEQPTRAEEGRERDEPLPVEVERPEIVLAKASGNTEEELEEAVSDEPTPAPSEMRAEPIDGICPASHPIKGNRGSMGALIYHVPGGRNYDRTKPEACFATIEDAEAAGYRAPRG